MTNYGKLRFKEKPEYKIIKADPPPALAKDSNPFLAVLKASSLEESSQSPSLNPNPTLNSKALAEIAMMVALSVIMGIIGQYVPIFSIIGLLFFPLPTAILVLRRGLKAGIIAVICTAVILCLFINIFAVIIMVFSYLLLGLFLGYAFLKGYKPMLTITVGTFISALGMILNLLLSSFLAGLPLTEIYVMFEESVDMFTDMMVNTYGNNLDTLLNGMTIEQYKEALLESTLRIAPAGLILCAIGGTALFYIIFTAILRRLNYKIQPLPPFSQWRMDWRMVWGIIIGLFLNLLGAKLDNQILSSIGQNLLVMYYILLFVFGVSLIIWLIKHSKIDSTFKIIIAVLLVVLLINNTGFFIIILLGLFDPILDIRKRISELKNKTAS